jgi:hypothetical protein
MNNDSQFGLPLTPENFRYVRACIIAFVGDYVMKASKKTLLLTSEIQAACAAQFPIVGDLSENNFAKILNIIMTVGRLKFTFTFSANDADAHSCFKGIKLRSGIALSNRRELEVGLGRHFGKYKYFALADDGKVRV